MSYTFGVDARETLRVNLEALMSAAGDGLRPGPTTPMELAAKAAVGKTTVYDSLSLARSVGIDKLDKLAGAFGLPAWALLVPDLVTDGPVMIVRASELEREVTRRVAERWAKLRQELQALALDEGPGAGPSVADPYPLSEVEGDGTSRPTPKGPRTRK